MFRMLRCASEETRAARACFVPKSQLATPVKLRSGGTEVRYLLQGRAMIKRREDYEW